MLTFQLHSSVLLTPRALLLKAMTQTRQKGIICNCSMLTPARRAFKWYMSLLPSCRHILVSQTYLVTHVIHTTIYLFNVPRKSSGKALGYELDAPGSIPGVGGVEIFLRSFVPTLVHYKMSTGDFPVGKGGRA